MRILLTALALYVVALPALLYGLYLWENGRRGQLDGLRSRPGGLAGIVLSGWISGMFSHLLVVLTYPLGLVPAPRPGGGPPVVLVHGLYHNRSAWLLLWPRLARAGFRNLRAVSYPSFGRDFAAILEGLVREVEDALADNPGQRVALVGHSLGGLLVRAALADPRLKGRVFAAATLGAPHRGSRLAALGIGALARSLAHQGPLVQGVERIEALSGQAGVPKLNLYTPADDFVTPLTAMRVQGPGWSEAECPAMSHVSLIYSRRVARMLGKFLTRHAVG